jgi:hypothetical protein
MKTTLHLTALVSWLAAGVALAGEPPRQPQKGSAEFERLKALVGSWKATADMGQGPMDVSLEYRLVAGGSVLEERIFAGTPMEMVTMYHDKKGRLALTHYCMLANQPGMLLKSSDAKTLRFDFDQTCGINARTEDHMHALTLTFVDADTLRQEWQHYEKGKPSEKPALFVFQRAKP